MPRVWIKGEANEREGGEEGEGEAEGEGEGEERQKEKKD